MVTEKEVLGKWYNFKINAQNKNWSKTNHNAQVCEHCNYAKKPKNFQRQHCMLILIFDEKYTSKSNKIDCKR